jgi:hypothetical protein
VLLRASNPYVARFRALDVPVVTIPGGASGPAYQDGRAVASVRGSRLVHRLKSSMLGERVVHLAGVLCAAGSPRAARCRGRLANTWPPSGPRWYT